MARGPFFLLPEVGDGVERFWSQNAEILAFYCFASLCGAQKFSFSSQIGVCAKLSLD
jgi:hypothetical protein